MFAERVEARGKLTGGGGFAGIDVADNDHVDVHLFLTAERWQVSKESIKIHLDIVSMSQIEGGWKKLDGMLTPSWRYWKSTVLCVVICFLVGKRFESVEGGVSDDTVMNRDGGTHCTE